MSSAHAQIEEQKATNQSSIDHFAFFEEHRRRVTALALAAAAKLGPAPRLCVLGAGNCYDLDLAELGGSFAEIHLVDLDGAALARACERQDEGVRARLHAHAPVDLTGALERVDAWKRMEVTPQELMAWPSAASSNVAKGLPGPFDVVISACVLSQLHFAMLNVLSDKHRLFEPVRQLLNLVHLRTVAQLLAPASLGLLINDVASDEMIATSGAEPTLAPLALLQELARRRFLIHAVEPAFLEWSVREDPFLCRTVQLAPPKDAWHWQVGPDRSFLVCAQQLTRRP